MKKIITKLYCDICGEETSNEEINQINGYKKLEKIDRR